MHLGKHLVKVRALSGSGAAFPACLAAHCDCSNASSHTSVPMLSLHNPFDVLGDLDFFPEEIVDELMFGAETASGEVPATMPCSNGAAAQGKDKIRIVYAIMM